MINSALHQFDPLSHRVSFQRHDEINFFPLLRYRILVCCREYSPRHDFPTLACTNPPVPAASTFVFVVDCGFGKPKWRRSHATGHQRDTRGFDGWIIYPIMSQRKGLPPCTAPRPCCIINAHYDEAKASLLAVFTWDRQSGRALRVFFDGLLPGGVRKRIIPLRLPSIHFTVPFTVFEWRYYTVVAINLGDSSQVLLDFRALIKILEIQ